MSEKRKDNKGRILKTGESQRKDLIYQYRYTDIQGKRQTVYSSSLQELRRKEADIQKQLNDGVNYSAGQITIIELVKRYLALKQGVRYNTQAGYNFIINLMKNESFCLRKINSIRISDAKQWFIKLQQDGRTYGTIANVKSVIQPAFQMAYDEDMIKKNPFSFKMSDVIKNNSECRQALTSEQVKVWMDFVKSDSIYHKYYDEFVILLGTGIRVSELCGLTLDDLDFPNKKINIKRQLIRKMNGDNYIEKTKTKSGVRCIPMIDDVYYSLKKIIDNRPKVHNEISIDGVSNFLLLDRNCNPKVAFHIQNEIRSARRKYNKLYPDQPLPQITPHVLRHTFCTYYATLGISISNLQYLMGHSDARITLNTYTHANSEDAAKQMLAISLQNSKNV